MTFYRGKKLSLGTCLLICFILTATLFIAIPGVTLAQQTTTATAAQTVPSPTQCSITITNLGAIFNPICWGRFLGSLIGGLIVYIASWILTVAGVLFNWSLNITVVQFGQFLTSSVLQGITTAWTAFRDISNIVIIGMFTFIAISIILGLKEFGQKKLIARVLIIAVLINFSLLFTKIVIDASNFTATQFYNAALNQSAAASTNSTTQFGVGNCPTGASNSQCYGIAGAFMDYAGVSGFGDTAQALRNLADSLDNGYLALLFAVFTAAIFLGAAFVLFYGTFLLISRAVLFIFLMVTASLAFASYLVPVWDTSSYGFGAWRKSLLGNAALAPLLMLFLWMTLNIANAMKAGEGGGTIGDLLTNPTKNLDINALFSYIVVLGLLFGSFKLSHRLSEKIAGFHMFRDVVVGLGSLPLVGAAAYLGPGLYRRFLGYPSAHQADGVAEKIKEKTNFINANRHILNAGDLKTHQKELDRLRDEERALRKDAGRTGDFRNSPFAKSILSAAGVPKWALGAGTKTNAADTIKTRGEDVAKSASGIAVTGTEEATKLFKEQRVQQRREARERHRTAEEELAAVRKGVDEQKRNAGLVNVRATAEEEIQEASTQKELLSQQPKTADRQRQLDEQEARIDKARENLTRVDKIEEPLRTAKEAYDTAAAALAEAEREPTENDINQIIKNSRETAKEAAEHHAKGYTLRQRFTRALSERLPKPLQRFSEGHNVARNARKQVEARIKMKPLIEKAKAEKEALSEIGEKEAHAEAPIKPPDAH